MTRADEPTPSTEGRKDDSGKARYDLIPFEALDAIVGVLTHGANEYGDDNWRLVPDGQHRYFAAALRHLTAWRRGEERDPKSGMPHLAHAAANIMFLLELKGAS